MSTLPFLCACCLALLEFQKQTHKEEETTEETVRHNNTRVCGLLVVLLVTKLINVHRWHLKYAAQIVSVHHLDLCQDEACWANSSCNSDKCKLISFTKVSILYYLLYILWRTKEKNLVIVLVMQEMRIEIIHECVGGGACKYSDPLQRPHIKSCSATIYLRRRAHV